MEAKSDFSHRSQDAHDCPGPSEDTVRNDASIARRAHAQEVLARTMPQAAGKARLTMPKQVDKTRSAPPPDPTKLPPSVIAEQEREAEESRAREQSTSTPTPVPASALAPSAAPAVTPAALASTITWTDSPAYAKLHKIHCVKVRSLSKPLDPRTPREQSRAVEWTVDLGGERVRTWAAQTDSFKPDKAAVTLGERKAERIWVPEVGWLTRKGTNPQVMPGGKLFDNITSAAKLTSGGEVCPLLCSALTPAPLAHPCLSPAWHSDSAGAHRPLSPRRPTAGPRRRPRPRSRMEVSRVYMHGGIARGGRLFDLGLGEEDVPLDCGLVYRHVLDDAPMGSYFIIESLSLRRTREVV